MSKRSRGFRPVLAALAMRRLLEDPNRTEEAFNLIRFVAGDGSDKLYQEFNRRPEGRKLLRDKPDILKFLADTNRLSSLPEGSLGRAYLAFCQREGIAPGGLVEASRSVDRERLDPDRRWIADRMRDTHDLYHVVGGYRSDLAGELSVLAFTTAQTGSLGTGVLVLGGMLRTFQLPELGPQGRRLAREAFLRGLQATWLPGADWEALLPRPLDEVRTELGILSVPVYRPYYKEDFDRAIAA